MAQQQSVLFAISFAVFNLIFCALSNVTLAQTVSSDDCSVGDCERSMIVSQSNDNGEFIVDEGLAAHSDVTMQQADDLAEMINKNIIEPITNGDALEIKIGRPQIFNRSILRDKEQQVQWGIGCSKSNCPAGVDEWLSSDLYSRIESPLRDCRGTGICKGDNIFVFSVRVDLKSDFKSAVERLFDEIGSEEPFGSGSRCPDENICFALWVNRLDATTKNPIPQWILPKRWRVNGVSSRRLDVGYDFLKPPLIEVIDRNDRPIVQTTLGNHAAYDDNRTVYLFDLGGSLQGSGRPSSNWGTSFSYGYYQQDREIYIYSGHTYFVLVNLGTTPLSEVGKLRVRYDY